MKADTARFDTRISKEQKDLFEYAASLGGYRTLTEFIISSAQQKANEIVDKHRSLLASKKDRAIFFRAILNPPEPSDTLRSAAARYSEIVARK